MNQNELNDLCCCVAQKIKNEFKNNPNICLEAFWHGAGNEPDSICFVLEYLEFKHKKKVNITRDKDWCSKNLQDKISELSKYLISEIKTTETQKDT